MGVSVNKSEDIEKILLEEGVYASVTNGKSMRPLFKTHRDMVVLKKAEGRLKKYDVVLYRVGDNYILHRIIKVLDSQGIYLIRGDNTFHIEKVPFKSVLAYLISFNRNGKHHTVDERSYKIYSSVWNFIYPLRYLILYLPITAARKLVRVFKKKT